MTVKSISSTAAKNNFGQLLEDVTENRVRYFVERHGVPKAVIISLEDFSNLLRNDSERQRIQNLLQEIRPRYRIGRSLSNDSES
jgi:prevent-host-death family protein